MNRRTASRFGAAVLIIGLSAGAWFVVDQLGRDKARAAASARSSSVRVDTERADTKAMPAIVRGIGTVQAYKTVAVKSRVDGQIVKIAFEEGQEVKVGDLLFQIDPRAFQAAYDQAV